MTSVKKKAVFLDRDGTINVEKDYLCRVEDFEFIPGAPEAIRRLKDAGFLVIVVTNQSGVARRFFGVDDVERLHQHMQSELRRFGTGVDRFYICPHHPTEGRGEWLKDCLCRKGRPGMLLDAERDYDIDFSQSFMVGDKPADIEAGQAAGCRSLLVLTGYGASCAESEELSAIPKFADLGQAADYILSR